MFEFIVYVCVVGKKKIYFCLLYNLGLCLTPGLSYHILLLFTFECTQQARGMISNLPTLLKS